MHGQCTSVDHCASITLRSALHHCESLTLIKEENISLTHVNIKLDVVATLCALTGAYTQIVGHTETAESFTYNTTAIGPSDVHNGLLMSRNVDFALSDLMSQALTEFVKFLDWRRLTVLIDKADPSSILTAEKINKLSHDEYKLDLKFLQVNDISESGLINILQKVKQMLNRIVVLSTCPHSARGILSKARATNMKWPDYVWIVLNGDSSRCNNQREGRYSISCGDNIMERVIVLQPVNYFNTATDVTLTLRTPRRKNGSLYEADSLDACQQTINDTSYVDIFQCVSHQLLHVSQYNREDIGLSNVNISGHIPSDALPQFVPILYTVLFFTGMVFCFTAITITFVLYLYYRKERSIKATSVSLSILIFIGCYLLVLFMLLVNIQILPLYHKQSRALKNAVCSIAVFVNATACPVVVIISTLIVKMLRVYRIFNEFKELGKSFNGDLALSLYVLLLTSPTFLICLIWFVFDPIFSETIKDQRVFITERCISDYLIHRNVILFFYIVILSVFLISVAIKSRKIKRKNFKDTKKLCALSYFLVLTGAIAITYWCILRLIQADSLLINALLQVTFIIVIFECLGLIFAPKILPLLKDRCMQGSFGWKCDFI